MKQFIFPLLIFSFLISQWSTSPENPVNIGGGIQPQLAALPGGSLYISWLSESEFHVYLQRLNPEGIAQFEDNGLLISDHPTDSWIAVFHLNLATDSEGNAILSFIDMRTGVWNAFAYKISPGGEFLWGNDGIQLSPNTTGNISPRVTILPEDSAVVTWVENFSIVHAQKITASGTLSWGPGGIVLSDPVASLVNPYSVISDDGNLILRWIRQTGPYWSPTSEIFEQMYDPAGSAIWGTPAGVSGPVSFPMGNWHQRLLSDGTNGSYSAWTIMTTSNQSGFAQRVDSEGTPTWGTGVELSTFSDHFRTNPSISVAQDSHEMTAFWTQANSSQSQHGIYTQRLSTGGIRQWGNSGIPAVPLNTQYSYLDLSSTSFGEDGVAIYIQQTTDLQSDIFALKINAAGEFGWNPGIYQVTTSGNPKSNAASGTGPGCVFISWTESGIIKAHCLREDGTLGPPVVEGQCTADGDVNFDGDTNVLDIVSVVNFILGMVIPTPDQICAADLNSDNTVNVLDVVMIVNQIVGG